MLDTKPKTILTEDYVNNLFFQYLDVVTKQSTKFHGLVLGNADCNKLVAVKKYLEEKNVQYKIVPEYDIIAGKIPDDKVVVVITTTTFINNNRDFSTALKLLIEKQDKKFILVCDECGRERYFDFNYTSLESRCVLFHYPNY